MPLLVPYTHNSQTAASDQGGRLPSARVAPPPWQHLPPVGHSVSQNTGKRHTAYCSPPRIVTPDPRRPPHACMPLRSIPQSTGVSRSSAPSQQAAADRATKAGQDSKPNAFHKSRPHGNRKPRHPSSPVQSPRQTLLSARPHRCSPRRCRL